MMSELNDLDAEAATALAALEAVGAGRPQSWERAFDLLQFAAERGSLDAEAQLRLLAANRGAPEGSDQPDWAAMRAEIDVDALLAVPERESLSEQPRIRVARSFASPAECEWIIAKGRAGLKPGMIWDPVAGGAMPDPGRTNSAAELSIADMDVVIQLVRARIAAATRLPLPVFEPPQLLHYRPGQEFAPHHDFLDPGKPGHRDELARFGQRIATFLIYLNDDFDGGETEFPTAGVRFRGGRGDALFFANVDGAGQPDPTTLHRGCPPTRGEKYLFSQWIRDRSPAG